MSFVYPTSQEIMAVEAERLPNLVANRPIFDIMPIATSDSPVLRWEQEDNVIGLQGLRGIGGQPGRVKGIGGKTYVCDPGFYGEFRPLDEVELMTRRQWASAGVPINVSDLVMKASEQLQSRYLDRIEYIGWKALQGTFSVLGPAGTVIHTDTFSVQTAAAGTGWSTFATAKPIFDLRAIKTKGRGRGVSFARGAKGYANTTTVNNLLSNTNDADLFGKRDQNQSSISGLDALNKILVAADLPEIVEYDGGYFDDTATFQTFIPDNVVILVGRRNTGSPICDYCLVRNVHNPNMAPGQYTRVVDEEDRIPRVIEVHNGHNGGPRIYQPGSVCVLSC